MFSLVYVLQLNDKTITKYGAKKRMIANTYSKFLIAETLNQLPRCTDRLIQHYAQKI
jgi:hypothetical protein